ncbi:hypothetical protein FocTR4_00006122 [Fusarium oxysporum f. sp. cubense]|uniref:Myb-like domain-containing protein n=1 Tax=Fusarium oxysporum f. sp. cubense TaxID=61366 RepID=A0A5C6TFX8_FUSOC|nr:hypothetical protein FocTR4_00006122 [Fusarium oxysporum f. sp. cubense]
MMVDGAISGSPPVTVMGAYGGFRHSLAPRLVPDLGGERGIELHHGPTEELVLPGTFYPMLWPAGNDVSCVNSPTGMKSCLILCLPRGLCLANEWRESLAMCGKLNRGGHHVFSIAALVWPGSEMIGMKEKRLRVCLQLIHHHLGEHKEAAGRHRTKRPQAVRTHVAAWSSNEHISRTMPAYLHMAVLRTPNPLSLFPSAFCNASMASATFDSEQRKVRQSLTPPASQPDIVSLQKKALLAIGKSSDTAICIPSDVESDTEDENDESRELNNLQSYATRASTPNYLDLTGTEHGATEPEAAIGVVIAPIVSPAQAEAAPTWPNETQVSHLADTEPSRKSSCKMNHVLSGDASASQDVNFTTPPTSPESEPYPAAADGQELRPVPVSEWSNMMVDAVSDHGACYDAQGPPGSPSTYTHSPRTASPAEVTQASLEASEAPAGNSSDDPTPGARNSSLAARMSPEPHRGQNLGDASCGSSDPESEAVDGGPGSPDKARSSPQLPSLRRSRRRSPHAHTTAQEEDSDADTESSGSEDGPDVPEYARDEDYCPSPPEVQGPGSEDDDVDDEEHQDHKRRKVSKSPSCSTHNAATSARDSHRRRRSTRASAHSLRERDTSALGLLSPTPPRARSVPSEASAVLAQFQEWPLENVSMKRVTENGKTTFQFQFNWPLCTNHPNATVMTPDSTRLVATRKTTKRASVGRAKYSDDEDSFLIQLKEEEQLGWAEIRRRFAQRFPERGGSSLQVHYCTKLKYRRRS